MIFYRIPPGVRPVKVAGRNALENSLGGRVVLDRAMFSLWQAADGCSLEQVEASFQSTTAPAGVVRLALACLAEAGLLERVGQRPGSLSLFPGQDSPISVVIVSHNSRSWLEGCPVHQ